MNSDITLKTILNELFRLNGILHLSTSYLSEKQYNHLSNQLERIEHNRESLLTEPLTIVLAGNFSSGKSLFLNALLGDEIVPYGEEPMTMIPNRFLYSDHSYIEIEYLNGKKSSIDFNTYNQLKHTTKGQSSIENIDSIKMINFYHPSPLLTYFSIIDTPGFSTAFEKGDDLITESIITEHADILLWVTDINTGELSRSELEIVGKIRNQKKALTLVCLLNKCDLIGKPDSRKAQNVIEKVKSQLLIDSVYPISSKKIVQSEKFANEGRGQDSHWLEAFDRVGKELLKLPNRVLKEKQLSLFHGISEWKEYLVNCLESEVVHYRNQVNRTYQFFNTFSREIDLVEQGLKKNFSNSMLDFSRAVINEMADIIKNHISITKSGIFDDRKKIINKKTIDKHNIENFLKQITRKNLFSVESEIQQLRNLVRNHHNLMVEDSKVPVELFLNQISKERELRMNLVNESIALLLTQSLLRNLDEASTRYFSSTFDDNRIFTTLVGETLKRTDVTKIMDLAKKISIQNVKQFLILLEEYYIIQRNNLDRDISNIKELIILGKNGGRAN